MQAGWGGGQAGASGSASQQAELILLWVVFTAIAPAIEVREGNPYRGLRVIHPGLPTPAAPSCFTTFLCRPFCTFSSSYGGGPPSLLGALPRSSLLQGPPLTLQVSA